VAKYRRNGLTAMRDPVYILTTPRSGSTLLRVMLAGHPELFCPPELNLLGFETMRERESTLGPCRAGACVKRGCDQRHGLQLALMQLQNVDDTVSRQMIGAMIDRNERILQVYGTLIRLAAPRRVVDKSPSYTAHLEILQSSQRLFREAQYIYLYRHPFAVIESLLRNGFEASKARAEALWTTANDNVQKFLAALNPDRHISISYERLVSEPEVTIRELCAFLNIEFNAAATTPYEGSRMTSGIRPDIAAPGDPNFQKHNGIDPHLGNAWRGLHLQPIGFETRRVSAALAYHIA
jgi:hypothetical protein